jgi:hypothetical protein
MHVPEISDALFLAESFNMLLVGHRSCNGSDTTNSIASILQSIKKQRSNSEIITKAAI